MDVDEEKKDDKMEVDEQKKEEDKPAEPVRKKIPSFSLLNKKKADFLVCVCVFFFFFVLGAGV